MNYKTDIEKLAEELESKKQLQYQLERNCNHDWNPTIYDPENYQEAVYDHLEPHGSDPEPIFRYYPAKRDRWSRTCKLCGRKEYTKEQKPTEYQPSFP
jgi:hypothetical protein